MSKNIAGFSKKTKEEKIDWLIATYFSGNKEAKNTLLSYWNSDVKLQQLHDEFIENTVSNFYLPLGVAPNFIINQKEFTIPMVIEESSVVAAAAKAAKYWGARGGFRTTILGQEKIGQVHFMYTGAPEKLSSFFKSIEAQFHKDTAGITKNMIARGGGISSLTLVNKTQELKGYYQLHTCFNTVDSMGANFINSCLEQFAKTLVREAALDETLKHENPIEIIMSILSNYVPNCLVRAEVSCSIDDLESEEGLTEREFAEKFVRAIEVARIEPHRAVTHNKGIMNGVDAVVLATGNDFRAVEAGIHAYASRSGQYRSLSEASIVGNEFHFSLEIPLAIGTVGGLTNLHPLVKWSMQLLELPTASQLMEIIAVAGLAQNFGALRSLVTSGIQKGHMKMHLLNILNQLNANTVQKEAAFEYFKTTPVSFSAVNEFLKNFNG
jgi:hydroxymethylglutaryl-CoA reductase